MTKKQLIEAILNDMYNRSGDDVQTVNTRWRGWLNRQAKAQLEGIYNVRILGK